MAADLWQLANGWELVDWSLNVGAPQEEVDYGSSRAAVRRRPAQRRIPDLTVLDDDAEALLLALLVLA